MYADPDPDPECDDDAAETARAVAVPVAATAVAFAAYAGLYGLDSYLRYADLLGPRGEWAQFLVMAGVVGAHGAVHAVGYAVLGGGSWRDVDLDFEVFPDGFEPVRTAVSPGGPIRRSAYLAGLVAPGVLLGVVPVAWALVSGNPLAMFVGAVGLLVSGSDVNEVVDAVRAGDSVHSLGAGSTAPDVER